MIAEHEELISDYLAGRATEEDLKRLEGLVLGDEAFRRSLLLEASMESHLRQTMGGAALQLHLAAPTPSRRRRWLAFAAAAMIAVTGWATAGWYMQRCQEQGDHLAKAEPQRLAAVRRAEAAEAALEAALSEPLEPAGRAKAEVVDLRGWVLALPRSQEEKPVAVAMGSGVPEGRALWTCPWGGVATRYDDGTRVSLDRSTVAQFSDLETGCEVNLRQGIVSVMRWLAKADRSPLIIRTDSGTVTMTNGQVAVVLQKDRMLVEVAEGEVGVQVGPGDEAVTVLSGHYAEVQSNTEACVIKGRLAWQLGPALSEGGKQVK